MLLWALQKTILGKFLFHAVKYLLYYSYIFTTFWEISIIFTFIFCMVLTVMDSLNRDLK